MFQSLLKSRALFCADWHLVGFTNAVCIKSSSSAFPVSSLIILYMFTYLFTDPVNISHHTVSGGKIICELYRK